MLVHGDRGDDCCDALLVKSSDPECSHPNAGRDRARVILTRNNGMISNTRFANAMGFLKNTPLSSCPTILQKYQEPEEWDKKGLVNAFIILFWLLKMFLWLFLFSFGRRFSAYVITCLRSCIYAKLLPLLLIGLPHYIVRAKSCSICYVHMGQLNGRLINKNSMIDKYSLIVVWTVYVLEINLGWISTVESKIEN